MDVLICWITSYYITLFFYTNLHRCKECHKTLCTLGPVFTGQVCNYLPSGRRFVKQYFILGSQMSFWFLMLPNTLPILIGSKCSRLVRETQDVFLGEQLVTTCPVAKEHLGPGDHFHDVIWHSFSRLRPCKIIRWLGCVVRTGKHLTFIPSCQCSTNVRASIRPTHNLIIVYVSIYTITLRLHLIFCIALGTPWHLLCYPQHNHELLCNSYHPWMHHWDRVPSLEYCQSAIDWTPSTKHHSRDVCYMICWTTSS